MHLLLVFLGGGIGALLRYLLSGLTHSAFSVEPHAAFPWGTLAVNLLGCLAIGIAAAFLLGNDFRPGEGDRAALRLFFIVGVLGGFTTFSTFGLETLALLQARQWAACAGYVLGSNLGGVALVWLGWRVSSALA